MGAINYLEIENEVAELGNALHMLKAYEKDGNLNFEDILEDQEFGTLDSINEIYTDKSKNKIKIVSIRSSSEGNCTFISNGNKNILVDCGISIKTLNECLCNYDLTLDDIDAIFITHKHSDHIKSIETILSKYLFSYSSLGVTSRIVFNDSSAADSPV